MKDRLLEHAIGCLERAKENAEGVECVLYVSEVEMIIALLKEKEKDN